MSNADQISGISLRRKFIEDLLKFFPEFRPYFDEHMKDNDELLPHPLMADLTRWVAGLCRSTKLSEKEGVYADELLGRALAFLERKISNPSDAAAQDLITVSFLEGLHQEHQYNEIRARLGQNLMKRLSIFE